MDREACAVIVKMVLARADVVLEEEVEKDVVVVVEKDVKMDSDMAMVVEDTEIFREDTNSTSNTLYIL